MDIDVIEIDTSTYQVTVLAQSSTTHMVTVPVDYALKLTNGQLSNIALVKKSFAFLLQREPNTSILRSFDLTVISRYFPDFEREISQ